jgi:glycine hydroxymethyltransferase
MSGKWFNVVAYGLDEREEIDYAAMERLAHEHKPKLIIAGASAYRAAHRLRASPRWPRRSARSSWWTWRTMPASIAAGFYPNPVPHADVVTTTTHKTLRGPRGGLILMKAEHEKAINSAIFPGLQGGPLMHVIAAKAAALQGGDERRVQATTRSR